MKKLVCAVFALGLAIFLGAGQAALAGEAKSNFTEAPKPDKKLVENEAKRRAELKDTEWKVTFYSNKPTDKDAESGSLVFSGDTMTFNDFKKVDLGTIGYTLTAYADSDKGMIETYKTTKDGNISLRADWQGQIMNGIISEQKNGGKDVKMYRFTSVNQVSAYKKPEEAKKSEETKKSASEIEAPVHEKTTEAMVSTEKAEKAKK